jgi:hypothetical protein
MKVGLLGDALRRVIEERAQGGPFSCCTLGVADAVARELAEHVLDDQPQAALVLHERDDPRRSQQKSAR